jgi:hypothetical protein
MATNSSGSGCSKDGEGMDCEHNNVDPKAQKIATFWSSRRQLQGWRFQINIKVWATIVLKALWAYLLSVQFYWNTVSHSKLNQMLQLLKKSMIITLRSCHYNKIDFCRNWALLNLFSPAIVKILSSKFQFIEKTKASKQQDKYAPSSKQKQPFQATWVSTFWLFAG